MATHTPKDWKSYDEQIEILRGRGMVVDDVDAARNCLRRVGYYRLSGYSYPFRARDAASGQALDTFVEGSRFSDVAALYAFDRDLRLLALDAIERIELAVQVDIAHLLGRRDTFAHEKPEQLHGKFSRRQNGETASEHEKWLDDYKTLIKRARRKTFVAHNLDKYGQLPIWVAIEIFDFGAMSKLYAGMKHADKLSIEKQFGLSGEFETWLRGLNFIRNTAAHHSRLWNCNILERASVPAARTTLKRLNNARPFLYFCLMQTMLRIICPESYWRNWQGKFIQLMDSFPAVENGAVKLADMGVVDGWKNWEIWK